MRRIFAFALLALPIAASAGILDRIYDFNDAHYRANGVEPTKLLFRKVAPSPVAVLDRPNRPFQSNVRILGLIGGYGSNGSPVFFTVLGGGGTDIFTNDAAGRRARKVADAYPEYLFPRRGTNPVGFGAFRQSAVLVDNHDFEEKNPLGLWIHVWVNYTESAFSTRDGRKALDAIARKNGLALDGTPILRKESEIEGLAKKGYVTKLTTQDASRYAVCPIIRDPRRGGISTDAVANFLRLPDGSFLEPDLALSFESLRTTGRWPR